MSTNLELTKWKKQIATYAVCNILYYSRLVDRGCFEILPHNRIFLPILSSRSNQSHAVRSIKYLQQLFYALDNGLAGSFSIQIFNRSPGGTVLEQSYQFDFDSLTLKVDIKGQETRFISIAPDMAFGEDNQLVVIANGRPMTDYLPSKLFEELSSIEPLPIPANSYFCYIIGYLGTDLPVAGTSNQNKRPINEEDESGSAEMNQNSGHVHKRAHVN